MVAKKLTDEADISATGEFETLEAIHGVEFGGENFGESLHARAAGAHESPVDVKQD